MFKRLLSWLWTGDAPAESGTVPGEAAPGAAPVETPPPAPDILDAGFDPETAISDDVIYRDAKPLREQVTAVRQEYGQIAQTLGGLSAVEREATMTFAPARSALRGNTDAVADLGFIEAMYPSLQEADRAVLRTVAQEAQADPAGAAAYIKEAAGVLRGAPADAPPAEVEDPDAVDEFGYRLDDPNRPLTQAEFDQRMSETLDARDKAASEEAQIRQIQEGYNTRAKELGYDPGASPDNPEQIAAWAQMQALVLAAGAFANDEDPIGRAHEVLQQPIQAAIDQYADGKLEHSRPGTAGVGAPPSGERVLETLEDMDAAAAERVRRVAQEHARR